MKNIHSSITILLIIETNSNRYTFLLKELITFLFRLFHK